MERTALLQRGVWLEVATVAWNVIEGVIAVAAGALASSVALIAFGIDSFVETASGGRRRLAAACRNARRARGSERTSASRRRDLVSVLHRDAPQRVGWSCERGVRRVTGRERGGSGRLV